MRVLLAGEWSDTAVKRLRGMLKPGIELSSGEPATGRTDILVCGRPTAELLDSCGVPGILIIPWAGLSEQTGSLMAGYPDIAVHNLHHNAAATAELAIGLMLAAGRRIVAADSHLRDDDWSTRYEGGGSLIVEGSRILILGYGSVGNRIGRICRAMGASVDGIRLSQPFGKDDQGVRVHGPGRLLELLVEADVLFLSLPLTRMTEGIIGSEELDRMSDSSILVNVGRGRLVDEKALFSALKRGRPAAAGLDVWFRYPSDKESRCSTPPSDHPFRELENVVMTPHMGGAFGAEILEKTRLEHLASSINLASVGKPVPGRVDPARGY